MSIPTLIGISLVTLIYGVIRIYVNVATIVGCSYMLLLYQIFLSLLLYNRTQYFIETPRERLFSGN